MEKLLHLIFVAIIFTAVHCDEQCSQKKQASTGNRLIDQDFGLELTPDDLISSMMSPWMLRDYYRPWRYLESLTRDLGSTIKSEKDKFTINLDVQHFAPEDISVRTADGYVVVEAKHEEKKDEHGLISRQFVRRYELPEGVETENVVSQLSSDGILTITAPKKEIDGKGERVVPITQTGPVRKEAKESKEGSCFADEKCKH
ncbi:protein lethal(2)essential for life-like [Bicyclus anynana]|uniref:Protein lethal(2)essential for life-like n=1 Tax=Bicyclus anynana TaxID=110368 RepID=A0A6J1N3M1_BICAN|nr:protein lethal(2)essential for life-like [Bicyclus anynana]